MRPRLPGASGVSPNLLFLAFLPWSWAETPTWLPSTSVVPAPTNVEIKSYNLNPQVSWNYPVMSQPPNFTVELKNYEEGKWIEVCTNISQKFCTIFDHVKSPDLSYWARVKATIGQKESPFADSSVFKMCKQGKIGPPKLKVQMKDHQLIIDISHPLIIVEGKEKGVVYDYYEDECSVFSYKVYWKINGSMEASPEYIQIIEEENDHRSCNETQCQLIIQGASFNSEYCVSAEGFSQNSAIWSFKFEKSEELCIKTPSGKEKDTSVLILIISLSLTSIVCLLVVPVIICQVRKRKVFQRETFILPKSLVVSVVRNLNSRNILEVKPETKYISIVETSNLTVPESEEKSIAHLTPVSSINSGDSGEKDHFQEISSKTEEMTVEENITEMISDSHQSTMIKENYFHPNSSQTESGSLISNSCLLGDDSENRHVESCNSMSHPESPQNDSETQVDIQDNITIRKVSSFGYDKPHVLVDILTDTNDKDTLIGYRPGPEPSVEIS
uniref:Interferon gamma receptor 1 n=1 Tax=Monodelphis domestica TaxID=13616 RepID=F7AIU8_MONDO